MISKPQRILPASLILFALAFHLSPIQDLKAQQPKPSIRQRFTIDFANQRCKPARLIGVAFGRQPQDVLLAQVTAEDLSNKTIKAVKLGWKVYNYPDGE